MRRVWLAALLALAVAPPLAHAGATSAPERSLRVGDVTLAYRSIGHGPPVVMIMGLGALSTSAAWFAHGADLRRIRAATLVGGGLEDQLIPPANQHVLARGIAGAKLVLCPDAAHGFIVQDWRSFGARVARFFGRS